MKQVRRVTVEEDGDLEPRFLMVSASATFVVVSLCKGVRVVIDGPRECHTFDKVIEMHIGPPVEEVL